MQRFEFTNKVPEGVKASVYDSEFLVGIQAGKDDTGADNIAVVIDGDIGGPFEAVNSQDFAQTLQDSPQAAVEVRINSKGGSVFDGLAIMNAMVDHQGPTTAIVTGLAASAGSIIAMGADEVVMQTGSQMFVHRANLVAGGNRDDFAAAIDFLDSIDDGIVGIYMARTGMSEEDVRELMVGRVDGTMLSAPKAVKLGFADKTAKAAKPKNQFVPEITETHVQVTARKMELAGFEFDTTAMGG